MRVNGDAPSRPVLRWHGGKWILAPWIISHFPDHRVYVEPFGGAASVLLRKERSYAEVYSDLDGEAVNLFRVLRDEASAHRLREMLRLTPFARTEFEDAVAGTGSDDPIEKARRLIVRSYMGFGADAHQNNSGFRSNSNRSGTSPAHDWANYPDAMDAFVERLQGVVVECRPATKVMEQHDGTDTLHYVDPPYLPETRSTKAMRGGLRYHAYAHEMTDDDHRELLGFLKSLAGMVVLSGYPSALYDDALSGWERAERRALADGARERTEVLWLNQAAVRARTLPLFASGAS